MNSIIYNKCQTPVGELCIAADDDFLYAISNSENNIIKESHFSITPNKIIKTTVEQLEKYFSKDLKKFTLPLNKNGTTFQKNIWNEINKIDYAQTKSYKEIAEDIKNPTSFRAVANACGKNNFLIAVPCHRVIRTDGQLGGFVLGEKVKRFLLAHEKEQNKIKNK